MGAPRRTGRPQGTSVEALEREFREELGLQVRAVRPLFVSEYFNAHGYDGLHEIGIYHVVSTDGELALSDVPFKGTDPSVELTFRMDSP